MPGNTPIAATGLARSTRDIVGRTLLWLAALGAAVSAASAVSAVVEAADGSKVVETWRLWGFVVFAGLFVLLALRPHAYRAVWELAIFNKLALTASAAFYLAQGGIADAGTILVWDGILAVVLVAAYVCCRGWRSWAGPGQTAQATGPAAA